MYRAVCGWGVRTAMAVSLLCGVAVSGSQSAAADTGDGAVPAGRSGLAWASGAFIPGDNVARHTEFGNWRGAPTDVVVTWTGRWVWSDIVSPHWLLDRWSDSRQLISIGVPPFPEGEWGSLSRCASGEYDHHWRTFGRSMRDSGMAHRTVIRLGWEFTGFWYRWAARNPWEFAACWRRVHSAAESEAPGLRWDWTVHRGRSPLGIDPRDAYPGDAYVDVVGVNSYDGWPGATDRNTWREHYAGDYGLKFWADFARQHGKKLSVPEWGVYPGSAWFGNNGGDNPYYIARMFGFFRKQADILAYESYFNETASYYAGALSLNPAAADEYRRQIRAARDGTTIETLDVDD
jgi:hypothetical protein